MIHGLKNKVSDFMPHRTQQFPPQKGISRVPTPARRDRGANNKRLPCSEAATVAFTAPIAAHIPDAHETPNTTRDVDGVQKVVRCGQLPGCLPFGFDRESLLTVSEFAIWRRKSEETVRAELPTTKGVMNRNRKDVRIHVGTFLDRAVRGVK